ncbi:MAG TPA: TolC family protein, partial [Gemmatimonadales bacterium]|nr:TolC family protein [Gemmatimonadales bacterium]
SLLEQTVGCSTASPGGGLDLGRAGFGAANTYNLGLSASQTLYSGGRISAQNRIAEAGLRSAELEVTEQNAQSLVTVAQRYYDAVLADRLLEIAEASLAQTEETLRLAELAFQVGDKAEYDVLRARVARTNQSNAVVQQRSSRDLAYTALKQQLELPVDQPLTLTTPLGDSVVPEVTLPASAAAALDTATAARVAVRQAEEAVRMQEGQVQLTRAQSRPSVTISSSYALSAYPPDVIPTADAFQDNWSVSLGVSIPIFDGGRVRGSVVQAQGALEQARVQLQQTRESAVLDVRTKQEALERARSSLQAMVGAVEEAQRAYEIAQLRYQQGLSSLTEVNDARLALNQAQADRAQAARDLYVAELQLLLVRDLPLDTTGAASQGAAQARSTGSAAQARPAATSFSPNP